MFWVCVSLYFKQNIKNKKYFNQHMYEYYNSQTFISWICPKGAC